NMIRIIFVKDGIRFSVAGVDSTLYSYESMNLLNYDFSDYSSSNIDKFIGAIDKVLIINKEVNQTVQSLVIITSTMIELLFFILLTVIFSRHPLPFKLKFKVAVYVSTIYVLLSLFALFTNNGIFIFAGIILLMVYMRKALSKITLL